MSNLKAINNFKSNDTQTTKIGDSELKSTVKLFENTSIFKSLSKVIFLAVIASFVTGLYVFIDQVLMTKILPINLSGFTERTLSEIGWYELNAKIKSGLVFDGYKLMDDYETELATITSIIRTANSAISPINIFCTAISLLIGLGTSIPYSKVLGLKNKYKIKSVWSNGFYNCIFISIITTLILIGLLYIIIPSQITDFVPNDTATEIKQFLSLKKDITIKYAINYCLFIVGFNILNNFIMLFISLLNSEGKNSIPTIFAIITNCINVLLDYIFLYYLNLGMNGSAIATIISYIVSNVLFGTYLYIKNKTHDTFLLFSDLKIKEFQIDGKILIWILSIGLASFLRNAAAALYFFSQQSIYSHITNQINPNVDPNFYVDILGAVNPIYSLFFSAVIGIIRGARTVVSYNYGRNRQDNVLKSFWITTIIAFCYGTFFYVLVCPVLTSGTYANGGFLWFFEITPGSSYYHESVIILNITMSQLILFSLSISGMLYFQATSKPLNAIFTSLVNGIIVGIPILLIMSFIAQATHNIQWYIYSPIWISCLSAIIVFSYAIWYIYLKKHKIYFER